MSLKVFIDGKEGTTGLRIFDRLESRSDFQMLLLPEEKRKDASARQECLHEADIAILCLPDAAARESVALAEGSRARILDTSTAHRIAPHWSCCCINKDHFVTAIADSIFNLFIKRSGFVIVLCKSYNSTELVQIFIFFSSQSLNYCIKI